MAGLQAGVLSVVDEGQQLAGRGRQLLGGKLTKAAHHRGAQQRHGAGATLGVERRELAKVAASDLLVGDAAPHAEGERGRDEPRRQVRGVAGDGPVERKVDLAGQVLLLAVEQVDLLGVRVRSEPGGGQSSRDERVVRPGEVAADVEVARDGVAAARVRLAACDEDLLATAVDLGDNQVVLAALAAEAEGKQRLLRRSGDADLVGAGEVPVRLRLQGDVDGVALGQELVQPEGEDRAPTAGLLDG